MVIGVLPIYWSSSLVFVEIVVQDSQEAYVFAFLIGYGLWLFLQGQLGLWITPTMMI